MDSTTSLLSPADSLTGYALFELNDWFHHQKSSYPLAQKAGTKLGYFLLALTGVIEALARLVFGIIPILASSMTKAGERHQGFYCRIFLFGAVFCGISSGYAVSRLINDKPLIKN